MTVVANQQRDDKKRHALDRLAALVDEDMRAVDRLIVERMHSEVALIPQLAGHIVASGGKRLRPMLTLAAARMCGYQGDKHCELAAIVEFIHTATLLHDDVVDASDLRRGEASANAIWGNQASVLVGDFVFSRAFELMVAHGSLSALAILSRASAVLAEGEVLQLITSNDTETTEAAYLEVIAGKTASLFSAACELGAVVAERPQEERQALAAFGQNLGIVFQLVDDVLDYSAHQADLGKTVGDDFREGKITLPVILAFQRGTMEEQAFWKRALEEQQFQADDLDRAIALMQTYRTLNDSLDRAREYGDNAIKNMDIFSDCAEKRALQDIVGFCLDRAF